MTSIPIASLLPNGMQQFVDGNGSPYANGSVYFYVPGTTSFSNTWQDPYQTVLNTNPIQLDGNGRAIIYGAGLYTQVLYDADGVEIWSQLTEGGGTVGGVSSYAFPTTTQLLAAFPISVTLADGTVATTAGRTAEGSGGGTFYYNASDTTTPDNGGTVRVDAAGRRWFVLLTGLPITPPLFGGSISAVDNTTAIQSWLNAGRSGFNVGYPLAFDGIYAARGPFTVTGTPTITGFSGAASGLFITGTGGGLTINCTVGTQATTTGGIYLANWGLFAGSVPVGAALTINFSAQAAAVAAVPTLTIENMRICGNNLTTHYWDSGITVNNGQVMIFNGNYFAGFAGGYGSTSHWIKLTNDSGVPAMNPSFFQNTFFDGVKVIWIEGTGDPAIEGLQVIDNLFVTCDYALYVESAGYIAPYLSFVGNQVECFVAAIYARQIAQAFVDENVFYVDSNTGSAVIVEDCNVWAFGPGNLFFCTTGSPSSGYGIKSIGTGFCLVDGGFFQNFTTAISLDAGSGQWLIQPFLWNVVSTPVADSGGDNLYLTTNANQAGGGPGTGLSMNGHQFGPTDITGDNGDASVVAGPVFAPGQILRFNTVLTADRTVTFGSGFTNGAWVRVVRQGGATGAHNLSVVGATTAVLTTNQKWVEYYYDGANWLQVGGGVLY